LLHSLLKLLFILFIFTSIYTQDNSKINIYFNIGLSQPAFPSHFSQNWDSGYSLGIGIGKTISNHFQIQTIFNFNSFPLNNDRFIDNFDTTNYHIDPAQYNNLSVTGGERNIFSLFVRMKYMHSKFISNKTIPYLIAGCGVSRQYIGSMKIIPLNIIIEKKTETAFLTSLGLGIDLLLEKHTNLFFELAPEICFNRSETTIYLLFKIGFLIK
jgi:hypothetical protein